MLRKNGMPMQMKLPLTWEAKTEAVNMLTRDYAAGIATYDEIGKQALKMADVMAAGIIRQFPNKFV